jgi:hypothetical protein
MIVHLRLAARQPATAAPLEVKSRQQTEADPGGNEYGQRPTGAVTVAAAESESTCPEVQ